MKTKLLLSLSLLAAGCTSGEPREAEPEPLAAPSAPRPSAPRASEPATLADAPPDDRPDGLTDEVTVELLRLEDEQLRLENEMAGIREDADDVGWVKARLANMVAVDQLLRNSMLLPSERGWDGQAVKAFMQVIGPRMIEVDTRNTSELRALIERHGWFNISTFGAEGDRNAWLLVQHADLDPAFQKEVLAVLEELVPLGETSPSNYAYLYDRVARAEGRPQRYGTQGGCVGAVWEPHTLEDPENVDELRSSVGLGTLEEYKAICSRLCR